MITREQIVECARGYLNTPFQHQGRHKGMSLDCVGLPICVARDLGVGFWKYSNYEPQQVDDTMLQECKKNLKEVTLAEMKAGDVICCRVEYVACHVAIVTSLMGAVGMVHAYAPSNKVVEHNLDYRWQRRIAGVFHFPGVVD